MSFPQVTEIAGPTASDFAFSMWGKVPAQNPTWDSNTIIADWGNAGAGTHRFTYWFSLANVDSNVGLRPRGQIRARQRASRSGDHRYHRHDASRCAIRRRYNI